ncbi:hypothetical protein CIW83_01730 [Tissierella sp. P1]|uniref:DUF1648 domain-containing protein n=1 Tax=Tissierella TaxID=41273 RepID=UPI000BA0C052|nr:DUF1648 domain-containing protein [Tissierella sp. P1]MDU5081543.1 DUF1648 domain-containing protein [Bacillota bacterium]OZV13688.1 hypothetical protein CIW83_01730 [Tissierella sp. P1]
MSERIVMVLFNSVVLLILLIMQILMPRITRKNILLGVKIPEEKMETDEVKNIIKGFKRENLIVGIPVLVIISLLIYYIDNIHIFTLSVFLYIGILFLIYIRWNKKSKELKKEKEWDKLKGRVVVIDTKFSRDRAKNSTVSQGWFLVPVIMILISTVLSLIMYPSLPEKIPTHWDLNGNVDGYMNKSMFAALLMPLTQALMAVIVYISYYFMIRSKQQINPNDPEISLKKNIIFRKAWSIYFIVTLTLIEILFTALNMMTLGLFSNMKLFNIYSFTIYGIIIIGSITLSIVLGQGGDRIKLKEEENTSKGYDIDDDRLWKLGNTIYYNPDDSSIFVEKRIGIGWTVNAGRPFGMFFMILPFVMIIVILLLVE